MKKITESGAYKDLTMAQYHGDCTDGVSVSSTQLRLVEQKSLRHAWLASHLNKDREDSAADHFRIGTALHTLAFEGSLSERYFAISPYDDFRTAEAKNWKSKQINAGKSVLKKDEVKRVQAMLESLLEEPVIEAGLFDERGEVETSVFHKDEETGLFLKVRPDVVPVNSILVDLKSTTDASERAIQFATIDYGYHMQLGLAAEVIEKVIGTPIDMVAMVFIEKEPPHTVSIAEIDLDFIAWGRVLNRAAMRRFADCLAKGPEKENFPKHYGAGEFKIKAPDWYTAQLTRRQDRGELPTVFEACGPLRGF